MKVNDLQLKRVLHTALFVLLLSVAGMDKMYAYDFSAVCPTGQTLYYNIIDPVNHYVELVNPSSSGSSGGWEGWGSSYSPHWITNSLEITWNDPAPIGDVVLPETVEYNNETYTLTSIGLDAFACCTELTSVTIPNSVTTIGTEAFYGCTNLTSIVLPDSLVSIGSSAFVRCTSLEYIELPNTVTSIGNYAFSFSGIKHLEIPSSVTTIAEELCAGCRDLLSVVLPNSVTFINDHAFVWCGSLKELIVLAETPPAWGEGVFYDDDEDLPDVPIHDPISVYVPCGYEDAYVSYYSFSSWNFYGICGGTVTVMADTDEGGMVTGGGTFEPNQTCTVTATANEGYTFVNWTENGEEVSAEDVYTFAVASNRDLVANFEKVYPYDFSAVCPSGQTLYYRIIDSVNHYVELVYPSSSISSGGWGGWGGDYYHFDPYWYNHSIWANWDVPQPSGDIVVPETVEHDNVTYTLTSIGEKAFIQCTELTSLTLPNSVTSIGYAAFYECISLTSIVLPDSLVSIGSSAFVRCTSLESIEIPNTVTSIEDYAFSYSGIKHLEIPSSVTTIAEELCAGCEDLLLVVLPNTVTYINDHAFVYSDNLKEMIVFAETPPALGVGVFYEDDIFYDGNLPYVPIIHHPISVYVLCGYEDVYDSHYSFPSWNFYGICGGTVTVAADPEEGGTVTGGGIIEEDSFCTVTAVSNEGYTFEHWELDDGTVVSNTVDYTFIVCNDLDLVAHFVSNDNIAFADANVKSICVNHWDSNNDGELSYAEAALVTDLGNYFQSNSQIASFNELQYFTGLSAICDAAFNNCRNLNSVVLPNSLTSIGDEAFYGCSSLKGSLIFPNYLTSIGNYAFCDCSRLIGSLTFPNFLTSIGDHAFSGCSSLTGSLTFPYFLTSIGNYAFYDCNNLTGSLTFPNFLTSIGDYTFYNCRSLTGELIIPNSVTSIGNYAFYECIGLTGNLIIPNSVTSIGNSAFSECSGLTGELIIPNSVTSIGNSTFSHCSGLTGELIIPNSVTSIGEAAFLYCGSFDAIIVETGNTVYDSREICNAIIVTGSNELILGCKNSIIPNSVTSISSYAFSDCSGLTSLTVLAETPPTLASYNTSFYNCPQSIPVYVPCGTSEIYATSSGWNYFSNFIDGCSLEITAIASPVSAGEIIGNGLYDLGTTCTLSAIANPGYTFVNWTLDGEVVSTVESYSFTVTKDANYVANFESMTQTFTKMITGYSNGTGEWHIIASPLAGTCDPTSIINLIADAPENYDLYRFNPSAEKGWENWKQQEGSNYHFNIESGKGYLYANKNNVTLTFIGTPYNGNGEVTLHKTGEGETAGWNLVGNPFNEIAYIDREFYVMSADGSKIELAQRNYILPMEGVFVIANEDGEVLTFRTSDRK